ncbi:endolysin [Arthrobacter phage Chubster]|uniref:Endolysin n=1 Tax=Arthrobacter phage Chubster TaxID=1897527 RepID=A0A1I9SCP7_9CAUD|nr:endolysin [Arthrobacter phage Chubster]
MTKRQFLVTVQDNDESDEMLGSYIRGTIDGQVTVERLADTVGGFPAIWSNYAQPGQVLLFQADKPNPYGHIEVVQDDGTTRRPEPGEILTSEGLKRPPVPGAILGSGGWVVQDGWKGTTNED